MIGQLCYIGLIAILGNLFIELGFLLMEPYGGVW